jgi:Ca-activated chloride channel family protein
MTFQWPLCLLLLMLMPLVVWIYLAAQKKRRVYAVRFTNLALLESIVGKGPGLRRHIPPAIFLIALAILIFSMARPTAMMALPLKQANVMLVFDVSGSMTTKDMTPNRIMAAKQSAHAFVNTLSDNIQIGVVSFNTTSALRTPLTRDHALVQRAIDALTPGGGTAIGDGLNLALDQLQQAPHDANGLAPPSTVVLLSDGANNGGSDPAVVAEKARKEHIRVNTIGIGAHSSSQTNDGNQSFGLDEPALKAIASRTNGRYFYANETKMLRLIYTDLSTQISWVKQPLEITALLSLVGMLCFLTAAFLSLRWFQRFP